MTLEQLRIFIAVAERLHFTQAAQALGLTQSAVSAAVAALESRYGLTLFDRIGRRVQLTQAGHLLLDEARTILRRVDGTERMLAEITGLQRGELSVMASHTIANYWLPVTLWRFCRRWPGIRLRLEIGNTRQVVEAVAGGTADLGIAEGMIDHDGRTGIKLEVTRLAGDRLVLVVGPDHPWRQNAATNAAVTPAAFTTTPWVLREPGSGTRHIFENTLRAHGIDPASIDIALELPSGEAIKRAVAAGAGATVISDLIVGDDIARGTLHALASPFTGRPFSVLRHPERYRTRAATAFLDMLPMPATSGR